MALKVVVKSLDEVPEALQSFYTQVGEEFVLDADDKDFKDKINEFRNNNIDLKKKLNIAQETENELASLREQMKSFEGVDPEKAKEAMEKMQKIKEKQLIDAGQIEELVHQRTERMRSDYDGQVKAIQQSLEEKSTSEVALKGRLTEVVIDNSLQRAVSAVATVRKGAMQDVLARGKSVWALDDDGKPTPYGADGNVMYGKDGKAPISMEEWSQTLAQSAPYLFEGNAGGGADGGGGGGGSDSNVDIRDQDALNSNLEGIAAGTVNVSDGNG